jgi:hypothetical protein
MEQHANGDTPLDNHVTMHEPQGTLNGEAVEHGKHTLLQAFYFI